MRNSLFQSFFGEASEDELQEMSSDAHTTDLEIRFAFLEDQLDQLSSELALVQRQNARLSEELAQLVAVLTPLLRASSPQAPEALDQAPPPHY